VEHTNEEVEQKERSRIPARGHQELAKEFPFTDKNDAWQQELFQSVQAKANMTLDEFKKQAKRDVKAANKKYRRAMLFRKELTLAELSQLVGEPGRKWETSSVRFWSCIQKGTAGS
jgi:hypothetical protein